MRLLVSIAFYFFLISTVTAETPTEVLSNSVLPNYMADQPLLLQKLFARKWQVTNLELLEPNQPKEISTESNGRQIFQVALNFQQFTQINVLKRDLNLKIKIYSPNGLVLTDVVSARFGDGSVRWIAENEGQYKIEIISLEQSFSGKYALNLLSPRPATAEDREFIRFAQLFDEGETLFAEGNQKSLQLAVEKYQAAFTGFGQLQSYSEAARAAGRTGEIFSIWGNNKKAYDYFKMAFVWSKKGSDKLLPNTFLNLMGRSLIYLEKLSEARQIIETVFANLQQERGDLLDRNILFEEGSANLNIGEIFYSEGNLLESLDKFKESIQKFKEIDDRRGQALGHLFSGYSLSDLGYLEDALGHYEQALALLKNGYDVKDHALVLTALGGNYSAQGEPRQALKFHNMALFFFRQLGDTQSEGVTLNGIAKVYNELNEPKIAYEIYKQSLQLFKDNNNIDYQSTTLLSFGLNCQILGKNDEALSHFRRSFDLSSFLGKKRIAAYALSFIAEIADAEGKPVNATAELKKSLKILASIRDRNGQAETFNSIGNIYHKNRDHFSALEAYRQALKISQTIGDKKLEAQSLYNIALTSRAIGKPKESLENIEQAVSIIESLRVLIANEILRMSYFSMARKYYDFYINLLMQLNRLTPGKGYDVRAWQASEKVRSRVLLESLSLAGVKIKQTQNSELNQREEKFARMINDKINAHSNLVRQNKPLDEINKSVQEMRRLFIEYEEIRDEIKKEDSSLKRVATTEEIDLTTIKAFLQDEPDTVLMEYLLTDEKGYLWTITREKIESYELPPRAEIEKTSLEYHKMLATAPSSGTLVTTQSDGTNESVEDFNEKVCRLSRMLLPPNALPADKKRLIIVPDKAINYVSFDALSISCSTDTTPQPMTSEFEYIPLITKYETLFTPSASSSVTLRKKLEKDIRAPNFAAIFADPVFEANDSDIPVNHDKFLFSTPEKGEATTQGFTEQTENTLHRLIYSSQEADQILEMTPPEKNLLKSRFDANLTEVRNLRIKNYQILHFATHSLVNDEVPEISGVYLSQFNKNGEPIAGVLRLQNIYDMDINADLIILSSCNSTVGRDVSGEGLISLSRGFLSIGAKSVVGSLWKIDDKATAEMMKYFYTFLVYDKMSLSDALRKAKLKLSAQKKWQSPYFWAGFVLQGEYKNNIEVESRQSSNRRMMIVITSILFFTITVIFMLKKLIKR